MSEPISIDSFRELFVIDNEFAVIDPRGTSDFAAGHLLAASNLPLQQLDKLAGQAIPLNSTLCILYDAGTRITRLFQCGDSRRWSRGLAGVGRRGIFRGQRAGQGFRRIHRKRVFDAGDERGAVTRAPARRRQDPADRFTHRRGACKLLYPRRRSLRRRGTGLQGVARAARGYRHRGSLRWTYAQHHRCANADRCRL